jgi:hypothetical protein
MQNAKRFSRRGGTAPHHRSYVFIPTSAVGSGREQQHSPRKRARPVCHHPMSRAPHSRYRFTTARGVHLALFLGSARCRERRQPETPSCPSTLRSSIRSSSPARRRRLDSSLPRSPASSSLRTSMANSSRRINTVLPRRSRNSNSSPDSRHRSLSRNSRTATGLLPPDTRRIRYRASTSRLRGRTSSLPTDSLLLASHCMGCRNTASLDSRNPARQHPPVCLLPPRDPPECRAITMPGEEG